MEKYPTLSQLDIKNPHQIARFSVYTDGGNDWLRVVYNRQKGSLPPGTRKYKFPQVKKSILVDGGTRATQTIFESSPSFAAAVSELEALVNELKNKSELKRVVEEELAHLEVEVAERTAYIRSLLERIE